jgi:TRAP-type uncharacterized transport system fused permease subunit
VFLAIGMSAFMAVFWSVVLGVVLSFLRPESRLGTLQGALAGAVVALVLLLVGVRASEAVFLGVVASLVHAACHLIGARIEQRAADPSSMALFEALVDGARNVVSIAVTCACAGIIVSVITLTGLGLNISGLIVDFGGGSAFLTVLFAAIAMWLLGTAVPVTASYIIAAVMLVPALRDVGVPEPAAHMFLFYYAVLADVSPPTALAPFAAAAVTRGDAFSTMFQAWKYCLPAFLVPFVFCLSPAGMALLMFGDWQTIAWTTLTAGLGVGFLSVAFGGWFRGQVGIHVRLLAGLAGLALLYADPAADLAGVAIGAVAAILLLLSRRTVGPRGFAG